jgi:SAM-dependent methyltransferase
VNSALLLGTKEEALGFPVGDLRLVLCPECGFAFNAAFDEALVEYSQGYVDSQSNSATFMAFATRVAKYWVELHGLGCGSHVLEIGSGSGDFLRLLCGLAGCRGTGVDPVNVDAQTAADAKVVFRADRFGAGYDLSDVDLLVCRHTLEHIGDVAGFLSMIRSACGANGSIRLGFEVPDARRILVEGAFWDIYYEHASYFTAGSLARAFRSAGFEVLGVRREYSDQYLVLEARPAYMTLEHFPSIANDLDDTRHLAQTFGQVVHQQVDGWRRRFATWRLNGTRVVLWGSGSKAVGFLSSIGAVTVVEGVVDINPDRWGAFMPGFSAQIIPPEALRDIRPDVILIMNPVYRTEIARDIERLGVETDILTVNDALTEGS